MLPTYSHTAARSQSARALATSLTLLLRLSHVLVKAGRPVEFSGLDDRIGLLRAQMLDLDPEEARKLRPQVSKLANELDSLYETHAGAMPDDTRLHICASIAAMLEDARYGKVA